MICKAAAERRDKFKSGERLQRNVRFVPRRDYSRDCSGWGRGCAEGFQSLAENKGEDAGAGVRRLENFGGYNRAVDLCGTFG